MFLKLKTGNPEMVDNFTLDEMLLALKLIELENGSTDEQGGVNGK